MVGNKFPKGKSGNPGGRPNIAVILAGFKTSTAEVRALLLKTALEIVEKGPRGVGDAVFRYAHEWMSDRVGFTKPKQTIDLHVADGAADGEVDFEELTVEELDRIIAEGSDEEPGGDPPASTD